MFVFFFLCWCGFGVVVEGLGFFVNAIGNPVKLGELWKNS